MGRRVMPRRRIRVWRRTGWWLGDILVVAEIVIACLQRNSGNSDVPHLHFHVMDAPNPLNANGLPFEFTHFEGQGRGTAEGEAALFTGQPAPIDQSDLAGPHSEELPLNFQLVRFPRQ